MINQTETRIKTYWTAETYNGISWNFTKDRKFDTHDDATAANVAMAECHGTQNRYKYRVNKVTIITETYENQE